MQHTLMQKWFRLALINLAIVAVYGTVMRYKILFNLPILEQKNLLHAHSHFAFAGWISHVLYTGLTMLLMPYLAPEKRIQYRRLIALNLFSAYGMLVSFTIQGYKPVSIAFSTLSIIAGVLFAVRFIKDKSLLPASHPSKPWATMGLLLNIISAAGPFSLAYMMATKTNTPGFYLGSIYYYLHFQYSGWFFFGSMALVAAHLPADFPSLKKYFRIFAAVIIPTFGLSILWTKMPFWVYIIVVIATIAQLVTWFTLAIQLLKYFKQYKEASPQAWVKFFFYAATIAVTLKFTLQAVSVIPSLSQLVFGFRPIVIAYLHLVLLGVYSLFLFGYMFYRNYLHINRLAKYAAFGFLAGVLLNELLLAIQGIAAFSYTPVAHINEFLFVAALILMCSSLALAISQSGDAGFVKAYAD